MSINTHCLYSIVVPVYNSEKTLDTLFSQLHSAFEKIGSPFEVVFIEDNSTDASWGSICELKKKYPSQITAIQLVKNFGQHNALICGLNHVKGTHIVTIDDDLQFPPSEIIKLIAAQKNTGAELVYGVPKNRQHCLTKNTGSWLIQKIFASTFKTFGSITPFRLISSELSNRIKNHDKGFIFIDGLLHWHTAQISYATVEHQQRVSGKSGYTLVKQIRLASNLLFNFTSLPIRLITYLGLFTSVINLLFECYFILKKIFFNSPLGYSSIITTLFFIAGILLFALGTLGEYLSRLYSLQNNKPIYCIREIYDA